MNRLHGAGLLLLLFGATAACAQDARGFRADDVERMKAWAIQNATGSNTRDCLETLNENLRLLYQDRGMRLGSTVDKAMSALQEMGRAEATQQFDFFDENDRPTVGVTKPVRLRESVWDHLVARAGAERGQLAFGLSPLDGNHSVLLVLDTRWGDPKVFWVDQWSTKGGWKEYPSKEALDGEIEKLTKSWWTSKAAGPNGVKFRSRCRLYPLVPTRLEDPNRATMTRVPRLRMRSGPGTSNPQLRDADGTLRYFAQGESFDVVERQGKWARLRLDDGTEAWGHVAYMRLFHDPGPAPSAESGGVSGALASLE